MVEITRPKAKRWELIGMSESIYCSSSGHHFIHVWYRLGKQRCHGDYCMDDNSLDGKRSYSLTIPKYFEQQLKRSLHTLLTTGNPIYYEYDQHGNMRLDELRYHYPGWAAWMISNLAEDL
jgi:hypothetical protein